MTQLNQNENAEQMDKAAAEAAKEIPGLKDPQDVAKWFRKWLMKAGYKRLSKALMQYYGV
jgi:hypothetical protein